VVITIRGRKHWLWRAVDANGDPLEILVQDRRNAKAAEHFLRNLLKRWGKAAAVVLGM
jgi:putative transposase